MNQYLRTILRSASSALLVLLALAFFPTVVEAQCPHLFELGKECVSPKNRCATDADCADADPCNGAEQCPSEDLPGSNVVDCTITLKNATCNANTLIVSEACDMIISGVGFPSTSCDILVSATTGSGCAVGDNLDNTTIICSLDPGEFVSFRSNFYVIQTTDPNPLPDQATLTVVDTCNTSPTGCSTTPFNLQITGNTDTVSGCSPGTPVDCPDDGNLCNGTPFCDPATGACDPGTPVVCTEVGRMTGGGSVFAEGGLRVTHGFALNCDEEVGPNTLRVNWGGNHFDLDELTSASCTGDPATTGFDTYIGTGTGSCNGVPGATIAFTFTDAGEPGTEDTATIEITGCPEEGGISVTGRLKKGNHKAHAN